VTGFFRPGEQGARRQAEDLLDLYRQQSSRVRVRFLDPDQNTGLALGLGVRVSESLVLQYRARTPVVLDMAQLSEGNVTAAILRLESARTPVVCWATGDGERSLQDADVVSGYSAVADLLRSSDYRTQTVSIPDVGVPATCDVLVVLQLGRPLADAGVRAVQGYLAGGGKLLLAVDPWVDPKIVASANALLEPYGAGFDGGLVVEPDPAHAATDDPTIPVVSDYGASPITRDLEGRYVFLPQATPLLGAQAGGATFTDLATTTDQAYAIPQQRTALDRRPTDRAGPFVLLRSIEQQGAGVTTRIVLSGTSAIAENRTMPPSASGANVDLLLASLDWLTQQDSLVAIAPRPPGPQPLSLPDPQLRWNAVLTAVVLPLLVAGAGVLVFLRRRRVI
jgi:ABC-type uncharacterized transport system involved in gliding motility auxiliary subunit